MRCGLNRRGLCPDDCWLCAGSRRIHMAFAARDDIIDLADQGIVAADEACDLALHLLGEIADLFNMGVFFCVEHDSLSVVWGDEMGSDETDWQKLAKAAVIADNPVLAMPSEALKVELTITGYRTTCEDDVVIAEDVAQAVMESWFYPEGVSIQAKVISREKE